MSKDERHETLLPLSRVPVGTDATEARPVSSGVAVRSARGDVSTLASHYPDLVHLAPTPVLAVDEQMRVLLANPAARDVLGIEQPSLVGYSLTRYLSHEKLQEARVALVAQGGVHKYRDRVLIGDTVRELDVSATLFGSGEGEFMCLSLSDQTDSNRERAEWGSSGAEGRPLLHLERAHQLEALGHLTGTFAHDFNNLLAVILGSLEAAERRLIKAENPLEDIQRALTATERSIQATAQILQYVRRRDGVAETVSPLGIVVELRGLIERAIGDQIELIVDTQDTPAIRLAAAQLETALLNLVINARDAVAPRGVITIALKPTVVHEQRAAEMNIPVGEYVSITVADDGCGMSEEVQARAFEPFYTTKPAGMGTGLGLSSVYGIMRGLGGAVTITSRLGQGTKVELLFPAVVAA
jgi:signal transduction histidine kinase